MPLANKTGLTLIFFLIASNTKLTCVNKAFIRKTNKKLKMFGEPSLNLTAGLHFIATNNWCKVQRLNDMIDMMHVSKDAPTFPVSFYSTF